MAQAAIYCRSSKDRAEVGLAAQRAELKAYAKSKGLTIADEFSDMEISGSTDETSRPGLLKLLDALRSPGRSWTTLLALDTSRIARDPTISLYVTRECEKHGVTIQYAKMPVDGESAFGEMMLNVVRGFDRLHARLSAEKGSAGLRTNIAEGFRAGGAAPFGFKLEHKETGGMRGGVAVRKSKLVLDPMPAAKVKTFLKARADGVARSQAAKQAKLQDKAVASLIAIERNALTYAGYTVWNQRRKIRPNRDDPRKRMEWRPKSDWIISEEPTHAAVITRAEADRILAMVDAANPKPRGPRVREPKKFVLSGLLFTPDGKQWHGDAHDNCYRAGIKGQRVNAPFLEGQILGKVVADFADRKFLQRTIAEARRMAEGIEADPSAIADEIKRHEKRLNNLLEMAADSGDKALLAKMRELEATLARLREEKAAWEERKVLKAKLLAIREDDLIGVLSAQGIKLRGADPRLLELIGYSDEEYLKPDELRRVLTTVVERIEMEPKTRDFRIKYRLPVTGVKVASPRGCDSDSGSVSVTSSGRLPARAPRIEPSSLPSFRGSISCRAKSPAPSAPSAASTGPCGA